MNAVAQIIAEEVTTLFSAEFKNFQRELELDIRERMIGLKGDPGAPGRLEEAIPYVPGTYSRGAIVTHRGALWQANGHTVKEPSEGNGWSLIANGVSSVQVRQGADPRDLMLEVRMANGELSTAHIALPFLWPRGKWESTENYRQLEIVTWNGCSWVARCNNGGDEPGTTDSWYLLVKQGDRGKKGEPGVDCDRDAVQKFLEDSVVHITYLLDDRMADLEAKAQDNEADLNLRILELVVQARNVFGEINTALNELKEKSDRIVSVYEENLADATRSWRRENEGYMKFRGDWDNGTGYTTGDVVVSDGKLWITQEKNTNTTPKVGTCWRRVS